MVFTKQMLCKGEGDINKAICMFVKREENRATRLIVIVFEIGICIKKETV